MDSSVDGHPFAGPDDHLVAHGQFFDRYVGFRLSDQAMCDAGAELKDAANGPLCPVDGVPLDALSAKCYEYHQCRGDRFTKQNGRQAGDCQSEVGTDPAGEQSFE